MKECKQAQKLKSFCNKVLFLSKKYLLAFYMGEDVKDKYKLIEKDIDSL